MPPERTRLTMGRRQAGSGTWGGPAWKPPWGSALLAASVLSTCFLLSQAARGFVPVVADPKKPTEGGNVTLDFEGAMKNLLSCSWYRGVPAQTHLIVSYYGPVSNLKIMGAAYTHREQILEPFCTLLLTELTTNDSETYFVLLDKDGLLELGSLELEVLETTPARGGETRGLSKTAIADIIVGCLAVAMIIAGLLYYYWSTRFSH